MGIASAIGIGAGLGLLGTTEQAGAQTSAANQQAQAAIQAAQIQAQSQQAALLYAKQQAAQNLATQNAMQQGNYGQWAAQQQRLSDFGQSQFGLQPRQIPAYVPIPTNYGQYGQAFGLPAGGAGGASADGGTTTLVDPSAVLRQGSNPTVGTAIPRTPANNSFLNYVMAQQLAGGAGG